MGRYRWVVLAAGTFAQGCQAALLVGLPVIAPVLRDDYGLSLTEVGVLLGAAGAGAIVTLYPWGLVADRFGERLTVVAGLGVGAAGLVAAAWAPTFGALVGLLALANAFAVSTNAATGRAVMNWFSRHERGFALGVRQAAVPFGGLTAAFCLPAAAAAWGSRGALLVLAGVLAAGAVVSGLFLRERRRPVRRAGPVVSGPHPLRDRRIWKLAGTGGFLVAPQVVLGSFTVVFLESERGLSDAAAAAALAAGYVGSALGRLWLGRLSDTTGNRLGLARAVGVGSILALIAVGLTAGAPLWLAIPALVVGGAVAGSWNGLLFTATVEVAGRDRAGAAVGIQQTTLAIAGTVTPLLFAPLVESTSWRIGFLAAATLPLGAIALLRSLGVRR